MTLAVVLFRYGTRTVLEVMTGPACRPVPARVAETNAEVAERRERSYRLSAPVPRKHVFLFQFDDAGLLRRCALVQAVGLSPDAVARAWAKEAPVPR